MFKMEHNIDLQGTVNASSYVCCGSSTLAGLLATFEQFIEYFQTLWRKGVGEEILGEVLKEDLR